MATRGEMEEKTRVETEFMNLRDLQSRIAFVIPTMNRPKELRRLLASVESQSVLPHEIIIVDGSTEPIECLAQDFPLLNLRQIRVFPPALTKQRNAGMAVLSPEISLVAHLDDDLVMEPGSIATMMRFWEHASPQVGGASFNIVNVRAPRALLVKSFFRMDSFNHGKVMRSGFESTIAPVRKDLYVEWLCGGATVWRRQVIEEFKYDEWFQGYSYFEDVDYSYRVGRKYQLMILADAQVQHLSPPVKARRNYALGKCQVINRRYFIQKHPDMSVALFCWATLGLIIANIGEGILLKHPGCFARAWGNAVGLLQSSFGRLPQIAESLKD